MENTAKPVEGADPFAIGCGIFQVKACRALQL